MERIGALPRKLGIWSAIAVLVGITIGSGIFRVPASIAVQINEPDLFILAWVVGGLITLSGALTIAELAAALPKSGGIFAYVLEGFGPLPAFLVGWSELTVVRASALGGLSIIFAEYLGVFIPMSVQQVHLAAAAVIALVAIINYLGTTRAAAVINLATLLKFATLSGLVLLAFLFGDGDFAHFVPAEGGRLPFGTFVGALIPILWAYDGWSNLSFVSGEVKDPGRILPIALIAGTLAIVGIYLSINLAFLYLLPLDQMATMPLVASAAAQRIPLLGSAGPGIIAALVMLSTFGSLNGSVLTGPRVFFGMAEHGLFFRRLAHISPRYETPSAAIGLTAMLGIFYVLANDFAGLADKFILGSWPFYTLAVMSVFILRRTRPDLPRPYRVWGYPVIPGFFLLASLGMIGNALWTDTANTAFTFGIILTGVPVYFAWRAFDRQGSSSAL